MKRNIILFMEGIAIAKSEGKYHSRKPMRIDEDKFKSMCKQWRDGTRTAVSIMLHAV